MSSAPYRQTFKIGAALPADDPVAVLVAALAMAWTDLMLVNRHLTSASDVPHPGAEDFYFLRISIIHLQELRESIKHARRESEEADEAQQERTKEWSSPRSVTNEDSV